MSRIIKAVVIHEPGPPEVLKIEERPVPVPNDGWVLIEIKAFGINRSELFTRRGHSPTVKFPRILGIEVVGVVVEAPGSNYEAGQTVATAMGGMGADSLTVATPSILVCRLIRSYHSRLHSIGQS